MAVSITWGTKVINVPKADLTLIQPSPEIRELDLDWFRLQLKDLEDDEAGMPFPDTHEHNTEVTVAGVTLSRVIKIINGYTVTFEDGQYAVNLAGANSNVADVANVNQVSLRSFNTAGLITVEIPTASTQKVQKATALSNFQFLMTDSTNHLPITGRVVTARRVQDSGAVQTCDNSVVEISLGMYRIDLTANDLNADVVTLIFTASGCDAKYMSIITQE